MIVNILKFFIFSIDMGKEVVNSCDIDWSVSTFWNEEFLTLLPFGGSWTIVYYKQIANIKRPKDTKNVGKQ